MAEGGKLVKLRGFPKDHKVKLFRVVASTRRTDYIITNDKTQESTGAYSRDFGLMATFGEASTAEQNKD